METCAIIWNESNAIWILKNINYSLKLMFYNFLLLEKLINDFKRLENDIFLEKLLKHIFTISIM